MQHDTLAVRDPVLQVEMSREAPRCLNDVAAYRRAYPISGSGSYLAKPLVGAG